MVYCAIGSSPYIFSRIADLIELRKLRKSRLGIDATKLSKGDSKRKKTRDDEFLEAGGLRKGADIDVEEYKLRRPSEDN